MPNPHITAQALENSAQTLAQEVDVLFRSGVPIVAITTIDPLSTTRILDQFVKTSSDNAICKNPKQGIMAWAYSHGFGRTDDNGIVQDEITSSHPHKTSAAISLSMLNQANIVGEKITIGETPDGLVKALGDGGITVLQLPQSEITDGTSIKNWTVVQHLIEIGTKFKSPQTKKREGKLQPFSDRRMLVLLVPVGFTIPTVLKDNMHLLAHHTPGKQERNQILDNVMVAVNAALAKQEQPPISFTDNEKHDIIAIGSSLTHSEFSTALSRTFVENRANLQNLSAETFLRHLTAIKAEAVANSQVLEVLPSLDSANVGGLDIVKGWIRDRAPCFSPEAKLFGIDAPKGIALIGPPGTGKSLIAKTISWELNIPCIKLDIGRVFNSLVGASEQRLREALITIQSLSPCVVLIDEVDKVFDTRNSGGDSGVGKRIFGTLLNWMQENPFPVFMVVTANSVEHLPPEFLRKGRLDELFAIGLPAYSSRLEVLKIHLQKRKKEPAKITGLEKAARLSKGYTPSELEAAVNEALIQSFSKSVPLTGELILTQLKNSKPLSESHAAAFSAMKDWAEKNARKATSDEDEPQDISEITIGTGSNVHVNLTH